MKINSIAYAASGLFMIMTLIIFPSYCSAALVLGGETLVRANGNVIDVPGYSVPSLVFWDGDSLQDLIVGEGGGGIAVGKVRVYLNIGTDCTPLFRSFFYVQSMGADLESPEGG
jgi:hypothetical protein